MLNENLDKNFLKTLSSLNELVALVDTRNINKISEIYSRVNSLREEMEKNLHLEKHPYVKELLEREFDSLVMDFADKNKSIKNLNILLEQSLELETWNKVLPALKKFFDLMTKLNPIGELNISVASNSVSVTVDSIGEFDIEFVRPRAYALTRELLDQSMIVTFNVEENAVKFKLHWQGNQNQILLFSNESSDMNIGFSACLSDYIIDEKTLTKKGDHLVYSIDQEFNFQRIQFDANTDSFATSTILHFSFLFRPLSLIIPMRGQILPAMKVSDGPGWLPMWSEQDVGQRNFQFIDWFKIIQS